ncbi:MULTISPECIES: NYN domain-containing protein [Amycolatopsis]|uniref:Predicted RNA-binding protein containing a PIN domain n=1 Tax=Amycolatopsis sacchari TaxID=115433 RepID=A0A1I4DPX5_9PSEU|nr:Predicted RNA-binding protein containing a PIN domain [Amycolatopsis sacchari]
MPPSVHAEEPEDPGLRASVADQRPEAEPAPPFAWRELPEPVRARLAELAAEALGKMPRVDVPQQLRPVAKFAPAKRAKLGATALLSTLQDSTAFRTAVLEWVREHRQDALNPNDEDSVVAATAAILLGESSATSRVRLVAKNAAETALRAERDAAVARGQKLEAELARTREELAQALEAVEAARREREDELNRLRGRLREQGVLLRQARDAAEAAQAGVAEDGKRKDAEIAALTAQLERERQRVATERARAERAVADAEIARQSAREARDADEVRLALLVDTIEGAVSGLRRELSLGSSTRRPADLVRGASSSPGNGAQVRDPGVLDRLLALPSVHLIVDGYNVTKTGYPELPLADQRNRLVQQLGALASRTGAEVTVVFDGAGVLSVPATTTRGVRVLFSDPGVLADDVIRALVTAEPSGRPLVVATSDRAVADSTRRSGAHPVASAVLLTRLGRV